MYLKAIQEELAKLYPKKFQFLTKPEEKFTINSIDWKCIKQIN